MATPALKVSPVLPVVNADGPTADENLQHIADAIFSNKFLAWEIVSRYCQAHNSYVVTKEDWEGKGMPTSGLQWTIASNKEIIDTIKVLIGSLSNIRLNMLWDYAVYLAGAEQKERTYKTNVAKEA